MRRRAVRVFISVALWLGVAGAAAPAWGQTVSDERVWVAFTAQGRMGAASPWRWTIESLIRTRDVVDAVDVFVARAIAGYDLTPRSSVWAGYANSSSFPAGSSAQTEHRFFQQYLWSGRAGTGALALRTRFEERLLEGNSGVVFRVRQQVRYSRPIAAGSRFTLVGWDEILVHANTTTRSARGLDQNRAFAGIGRAFTRTRLEVGYLNQYIRAVTPPNRRNHFLFGGVNVAF
jgi:hypothetical protein